MRKTGFLTFLLITGICTGQTGWDLLAKTDVKTTTDPFINEEIALPVFPKEVKAAEGKTMTLEGFIIPLQQKSEQDFFVLSRYPYQSCFFCGAAGPETVVEVYANRGFRYTDERVRVSGKLILNEDDPLHLFFMMRECSVESLE